MDSPFEYEDEKSPINSDSEMGFEGDKSDYKEDHENWYNPSDTENDIPDPNMETEALYQDTNTLPEPLQKNHFSEGLLYTMTLEKQHENQILAMIICKKRNTFIWPFFVRGSKRKTFHDGATDKECRYIAV